ncbi:hypothetical protein [Deinococcus ruber]|uniref:Uncharacterized protein n=1 Tax=Deinococcus ruber TaxID=1848197 RepID=A0A918BV05_9DEIO|nr:hypothetical protein [Deinococcus ruber]GGQ94191.1 hypothetical protein GCM10008957_02910 [Deinococcus ruber]
MLFRHGDVLIQAIQTLPAVAQPRPGNALAYGEVTGHSHRIREVQHTQLYTAGDELYLALSAPSTLIHEEHATIPLPAGFYKVWMQREYTPRGIVRVVD